MFFIDLDKVSDKANQLLSSVATQAERVFIAMPEDLISIPNSAIAYFLDPSLRDDFSTLPALQQSAEILGGNATSDDARFIRCFWEVDPKSIRKGEDRKWRWISKGGEYSLYYASIHLVVDWREDGGYLGEYMYNDRPRNGYLWGPKSWSAAYMGTPGVVWSLRSQKGISFRALPRDCAMSGKSAIVTTRDRDKDLALLGILNTERINKLARCLATFGSYEKGAVGSLPVEVNASPEVISLSASAFHAAAQANAYLETDPHYVTVLRAENNSIKQKVTSVRSSISNLADVVLDALRSTNRIYRNDFTEVPMSRSDFIRELAEVFSAADVLSELVGYVTGVNHSFLSTTNKFPYRF
jgi:hypothetical protein